MSGHAAFIAAAYAVTAAVLAALVAWVLADGRAQRRRLADLEARGVRPRTDDRADRSDSR